MTKSLDFKAAKSDYAKARDQFFELVAASDHLKPINLKTAHKALVAAGKAIDALASKDTDPATLRSYGIILLALRDELRAVVHLELESTAEPYKKLTDKFKAAAGDLKKALAKAKQTASDLNLAASVITAFTKIIPFL